MRRRQFIGLLGGAAAASPLAARAQQPTTPVIGFLDVRSPEAMEIDRLDGFGEGLKETGFIEGDNVTIAYRWAENWNGTVAGAGSRSGSPESRRYCYRGAACGIRRQGGDDNDPKLIGCRR